jgi:mannose-1-phosphate guanylyltransferase
VGGRPLIEYWFDLFEIHGIGDVLINTSYLADTVKSYVTENKRGLDLHITYEEELLGSGGTIKKNWDFIENEEIFYICYADNLTNINLSDLISFHRRHNNSFTLALTKVPNPEECGVVELDQDGNILSFTEKPLKPASDLAFAGIMLSSTKLKDYFPVNDTFDLGYNILPRLIHDSSGYIMKDYLLDIGTRDKLTQAETDIREKRFSINVGAS